MFQHRIWINYIEHFIRFVYFVVVQDPWYKKDRLIRDANFERLQSVIQFVEVSMVSTPFEVQGINPFHPLLYAPINISEAGTNKFGLAASLVFLNSLFLHELV